MIMARGKSSSGLHSSHDKMQKLVENLNQNDIQDLITEGLKARFNGIDSNVKETIFSNDTEEVPLSQDALDELVVENKTEINYITSNTQVFLFNYKSPNYLDLLTKVLHRIIQFSLHYTPEADPYEIMRIYQNEWLNDNPNLITIIASKDKEITGHMCAQISQLHGAVSIVITQLQIDENITNSIIQKATLIFENWRNRLGIENVESLAYSAEMANMQKKLFGAKAKASIYQLDLSKWVGSDLGEDLT